MKKNKLYLIPVIMVLFIVVFSVLLLSQNKGMSLFVISQINEKLNWFQAQEVEYSEYEQVQIQAQEQARAQDISEEQVQLSGAVKRGYKDTIPPTQAISPDIMSPIAARTVIMPVSNDDTQISSFEPTTEVSAAGLSGRILLSLADTMVGGVPRVSVRELSAVSGSIKELFPEKQLPTVFSVEDEGKVFFLQSVSASNLGIYSKDITTREEVLLFDDEIDGGKTGFDVYGDLIVLEVTPDSYDRYANARKVYLLDLKNETVTFIVNGSHPHFSPDGKSIITLGSFGVFQYDIVAKTNTRVIELVDENGELIVGTEIMKLGLSSDGSYITLSNFEDGQVYVFNVMSWAPFSYAVKAIFKHTAFWSVISPDNAFIAIQTAKNNGTYTEPSEPSLIIYSLASGNIIANYNLSAYIQGAMWITDWVK